MFSQDGQLLTLLFVNVFKDLDSVFIYKHAKKYLANNYPSQPHAWSKTQSMVKPFFIPPKYQHHLCYFNTGISLIWTQSSHPVVSTFWR